MSLSNFAPDYIRAIAPYQGGKPISEIAREYGLNETEIIKLASNENPLGMSPNAAVAIDAAMVNVARYPDGNAFELREAVSQKYDVQQDQIVFGNGSNDILELVARAFLQTGDEAIYSQHAFAVYPLVTQAVGAKGVVVPAKNHAHDLDGFLKAITPKTRLIFIANPNNPTGTLIDKTTLEAFLRQVPDNIFVILDEAYDEYLSLHDQSKAIAWLALYENLIISRTFSKAYGLAGLRIGFGLMHTDIADILNRIRQPFNVNLIAQAAAVAALADDDFVARSYAANQAGMLQLTQGLDQLGLQYIDSYANFISFAVKDAANVNQQLLQRGIIVRAIDNYELPDYLRVSIGLFSENKRFLETLALIIKDND